MSLFFPLSKVEFGIPYIITLIEDDCSPIMRRLGDLGFYPGRSISLLKKSMLNKSLLISLDGVEMMLRGDLGNKIIVKRKL